MLRYQLRDGGFGRVAPLAFRPEDLLKEWLDLGWEQAARWTAGPQREAWHARLQGARPLGLEFVQPCPGRPRRWQIGVNLPGPPRGDLPEELIFTVTAEGDAFFLRQIDPVRPHGCPGKTRPRDTARGRLP